MSEAQVAIGRIAAVTDHAAAVFLAVDLLHQTEGPDGLTRARVRLLSPYGGPGFGDYWMPEIGQLVLCFFPGLGGDGSVGGDIDEGYALGVVPSLQAPPQDGLAGALAANRRVFKGRAGTAYDRLIQGNLDSRVAGAEFQTNDSTFRRAIVGLAEWLGAAAMRVVSEVSLTLSGIDLVELISETQITALAPLIEVTATISASLTTPSLSISVTNGGTASLAGTGALSVEMAEVEVLAPDVRLGDGTLRKLIDERVMALYNVHHHGNGTPPNVQLNAGNCATVATEAS